MTATKQRPLRSDAARNLRRVLDAADQLFAEEGVGVSVEEIAARAGVGVGTVYRRFPSKEALIEHLVAEYVTDQRALLRDAMAQPAGEGIEYLLRRCGQLYVDHQAVLSRQLVLGSSSDEVRETLRSEVTRALRRLLERDQAAGTIRPEVTPPDVHLLMASLHGAVALTGRDAPDAWQRHLDVLLAGISPTPRVLEHPPMTQAQLNRALRRHRHGHRKGD